MLPVRLKRAADRGRWKAALVGRINGLLFAERGRASIVTQWIFTRRASSRLL
jgi:hypothetical protein